MDEQAGVGLEESKDCSFCCSSCCCCCFLGVGGGCVGGGGGSPKGGQVVDLLGGMCVVYLRRLGMCQSINQSTGLPQTDIHIHSKRSYLEPDVAPHVHAGQTGEGGHHGGHVEGRGQGGAEAADLSVFSW